MLTGLEGSSRERTLLGLAPFASSWMSCPRAVLLCALVFVREARARVWASIAESVM